MDVVAHNTKIMDLEAELFFSPREGGKEVGLHGVAMEGQFLSVCPRSDVIGGVGLEFSIPAHRRYMGTS
jgi:hypothetical protein